MNDYFDVEEFTKIDLIEKFSKKIINEQKIYKQHSDFFEKWLKTNDFDNFLCQLIKKHDGKYCKKCKINGFEPHPNNLLNFIIEYITNNGESVIISKIVCDFPNKVWFFKNYYYQIIWGQSAIIKIYDKNLKLLLLI